MTIARTFWAAIATLLCGCAAAPSAQQVQLAGAATVGASGTLAAPVEGDTRSSQQPYRRYVIQREDVLALSFPLSPQLNQTVTVTPDGFIDLQSAEALHVHVQGLTVPEVINSLKKAYAGILHDPIITVGLKDFQTPFFVVSGQVAKPGKYELRTDITIAEAVAIAGGMMPSAKEQAFLYRRSSDDSYEVSKVNLKNMLREDPRIQSGDMIYVPETFISKFKKYVPYSLSSGAYLTPTPY